MNQERINAIRRVLSDNNLDALIITDFFNRRYLSGFDGTSGILLIGLERSFLITDFRYREQALSQAPLYELKLWTEDLYRSITPLFEKLNWGILGFEEKKISYSQYRDMETKLPVKMVPVSDSVENLRCIKDNSELSLLRTGAKELDRGFDYLCSIIKPGMKEKELALELEFYLRRRGADEPAFKFIVASGKRGAMPHGAAGDKVMEPGELVTIDFGMYYHGYATDMTRTVALERVDDFQQQIFDLVLKAQEEAVAAVRPGVRGNEIDAVARNIIKEAGYSDCFGHGLGHGVGLETHEQPTLNSRSETVLKPGMVVTVEPGIYIKDWGGIRIEDMVCVTKEGVEILTSSPRKLRILNN